MPTARLPYHEPLAHNMQPVVAATSWCPCKHLWHTPRIDHASPGPRYYNYNMYIASLRHKVYEQHPTFEGSCSYTFKPSLSQMSCVCTVSPSTQLQAVCTSCLQ